MKGSVRWLLTLLVLPLLFPASALGQRKIERLFYYVDRENSYNDLVQHIDQIDILAPSIYSVDANGIVWGEMDPRVLKLAKEHGVKVMPLIVNVTQSFDQQLLHDLLVNDVGRARAITSMLELCRRHGYAGFQFDFENVAIEDRDLFTNFYRETAEAVHREGYQLSIAVVHRTEETGGPNRYHKWMMEDWRGGYDLKALAEIGDFISVMTYSQHTRRTPPGPSASLPWVEANIKYFLKFMPPEKLSLGIPTGGMRWYTSQEDHIKPELARSWATGLSHTWAIALLERHNAPVHWSDEHQVSYGFYDNGGTFEWIFFEDARSFSAKLDLLNRYKLRGFSVWVLGSEDPKVWDVLREKVAGR